MVALLAHQFWWGPTRFLNLERILGSREMYSSTPLQVSAVLSCELILSLRICCHAVFIIAHGGFGGIFLAEVIIGTLR